MKKEKARVINEKFIAKFFGIEAEEAQGIWSRLERVCCGNNETIVHIGDAADGMYFIDEGQVSVLNEDGEPVNELYAGQYFGEYAVLTEGTRLSTVKAHGKVVLYKISSEVFLETVGKHPRITGKLLKQVYGQVSSKHTKLVSLTRKNRGVMSTPDSYVDQKRRDILITYGVTIVIFIATFLAAAFINPENAWWELLPLAFLMAFTLRTKRVVEGMVLTVILLAGMMYGGNFVVGFGEILTEGIGNPGTASTIIIMAMVEAVAALLASAGVASAFKKLAEKHMKTKTGSLFAMFFILIAVCIDECLNVITAGYCLNDAIDKHKVPRETRALMGSFSTAICAMIPFSLWSAYISSWIDAYFYEGGNVFLQSIPFNFVGVIAIIFTVLLCLGVLPKTKQIKAAYERVAGGGKMWSEGSEKYLDPEHGGDDVVGRPMNLLIPMLVWMVSSVACGTIRNHGVFGMDAISGLLITLISMFLLYVGQKLMSPRVFFETMADGISNSLMPILLLVLSERIAANMELLGFDALLERVIPAMVGGKLALVPAVLFVLCTLICLGMGSCWGMYGLGIPVAIYLATRLDINLPLCLGATFAAGIMGESLCPYLDRSNAVVTAIGCKPTDYRKLRLQYWIPICILCIVGYVTAGLLGTGFFR